MIVCDKLSLILKGIVYLLFQKNKRYPWLVRFGYRVIYKYYPMDTLLNVIVKINYLLTLSNDIAEYDRLTARQTRVKMHFINAYELISEVGHLNRELKRQIEKGGGILYLHSAPGFVGLVEDWYVDSTDIVIPISRFNDSLSIQLNTLIKTLNSSNVSIREVEHVSHLIKSDLTEYIKIINVFSYKV